MQQPGTNFENVENRAPVVETPAPIHGPEHHKIETSYVGLPGSEKLVAETLNGEQMQVKPFLGDEIFKYQGGLIFKKEHLAIQGMESDPIELKGVKAKQTTEKTKKDAAQMQALASIFENVKQEMLLVKIESALKLGINANLCLMIPQSLNEQLVQQLGSLNYTIMPDGNRGFYAQTGESKLYFVFGQERNKPKQKPEKQKGEEKKNNKKEKLAA